MKKNYGPNKSMAFTALFYARLIISSLAKKSVNKIKCKKKNYWL